MAAVESDSGAFMEKFALHPPTSSPQHLPLNGLTFAIKDIFDVKGYVTGFGNPDWAKTHLAAVSTASAVLALLNAGVTSVGKTVMDEMAYSLEGENIHYGRPINPCAPDQISGGSSSGSAVAVAAKLVDFSLGTDTGGSILWVAAQDIMDELDSPANTSEVIPVNQSETTSEPLDAQWWSMIS